MSETTTMLQQVKTLLAHVVAADPQGAAESDAELVESTGLAEEVSRLLDVVKTRRAGEIGRRSRREAGNSGLAAQHGHVNAPAFLRSLTRSGFTEAARRIRVGTLLNETAAALRKPSTDPDSVTHETPASELAPGSGLAVEPSFLPIVDAVAAGALSIDAADRVLRTLTPVLDTVDPAVFAAATATLASEATERHADEVGTMARGIRDTLNRAGVADREEHLRNQRSLIRGRVVDGLRRVTLVLDPESDVILIGALDAAMSPRLGGPRFRDPADQHTAQTLLEDPRSNEQLALDLLVDLVRVGADADPSRMLGAGKPAVRVLITVNDLITRIDRCVSRAGSGSASHSGPGSGSGSAAEPHERADLGARLVGTGLAFRPPDPDVDHQSATGVARLEGHPELVSAATARRYLCNQGALPVILDGDSEPLDLGRSKRLFSNAQRIALSIRDGGCRWPDCDRPPSWTEAHHTTEYQYGGKTNLIDGISLCRRHHLLLHNNGWSIDRQEHSDPTYWLRPPRTLDAARTPIPMPPKIVHPT